MWPPATHVQYTRVSKRYQTDLSDAERALIAVFVPETRTTGPRRQWPVREIVNAIFYLLRGGIAWRLLPKDFPPWQTVYHWLPDFVTNACSSGSTTRCPRSIASEPQGTPRQAQTSSTANASRSPVAMYPSGEAFN